MTALHRRPLTLTQSSSQPWGAWGNKKDLHLALSAAARGGVLSESSLPSNSFTIVLLQISATSSQIMFGNRMSTLGLRASSQLSPHRHTSSVLDNIFPAAEWSSFPSCRFCSSRVLQEGVAGPLPNPPPFVRAWDRHWPWWGVISQRRSQQTSRCLMFFSSLQTHADCPAWFYLLFVFFCMTTLHRPPITWKSWWVHLTSRSATYDCSELRGKGIFFSAHPQQFYQPRYSKHTYISLIFIRWEDKLSQNICFLWNKL